MMARRRKSPDQFLEQIREEIGRDRTQVRDPDTKKTLGYLEKHVFDPGLTTGRVLAACELAPASLRRRFARALDSTVNQYVLEKRLTAAAKILASTDLFVQQVAIYVGYDHDQTFSRQFKGKYEMTPSQYRRKNRDRPHESSPEKEDAETQTDPAEFMRRLHSGELRPEEVHQHMNRLRELYPESFTDWFVVYDGDDLLRKKVEEIWGWIESEPFEVQRDTLFRHRFKTPIMFDFLKEKSLVVGRLDRNRGVQLAELSIEVLEYCDCAGSEIGWRRVAGWAWLGNSRRLGHDLEGAETALATAERLLCTVEGQKNLALADTCYYRAALRFSQRKFNEALELATRAVHLFDEIGDGSKLVGALIQQGNILCFQGAETTSVETLARARVLARKWSDAELILMTSATLASVMTLFGRAAEGKEILAGLDLSPLFERYPIVEFQIRWIQAIVEIQAGHLQVGEYLLGSALDGFKELGEIDHVALISIEIALFHYHHGQSDKMMIAINAALESLKALNLNEEAEVARAILNQAVISRRVSDETLRLARSHFGRAIRCPMKHGETLAAPS